MAESNISPQQQITRRRAYGRRLIQKASGISVDCGDLKGSPDAQFLSAAERKKLDQFVDVLHKVIRGMTKLGEHLEEGK